MHGKPVAGRKEPSVPVKFVSAGLAASVAEAVTIPIDTAKVRLQVRLSRAQHSSVRVYYPSIAIRLPMYIDP